MSSVPSWNCKENQSQPAKFGDRALVLHSRPGQARPLAGMDPPVGGHRKLTRVINLSCLFFEQRPLWLADKLANGLFHVAVSHRITRMVEDHIGGDCHRFYD